MFTWWWMISAGSAGFGREEDVEVTDFDTVVMDLLDG
jgi:hypothetical protein